MKTSSAKAKGRNLQKWVRDKILNVFPMLGKDDVNSRSMGASGTDIMLSVEGKRVCPYAIECKNLKAISIYKHYEQATSNAGTLEPLLVVKQNNSKPLVIVDAEHFWELASYGR